MPELVSSNVMTVETFNDILKVLDKDYVVKSFKALEYKDESGNRMIRISDLNYVAKK